jgi:hypothetical protein
MMYQSIKNSTELGRNLIDWWHSALQTGMMIKNLTNALVVSSGTTSAATINQTNSRPP